MKVLLALERLLESHPIEQITSGRLAREAGISRSTFYRQYASVDDVLVQLFDHVIAEMTIASDGWISVANLDLEPQLRGLHQVYLTHGPLLRAVADAEVGEMKATSEAYTSMMAMWDEAVTVRITESYPWVKQPALVAHALNAADERLMYYDYGKGPDSISEELFKDTFQVMYRMWCSAPGNQPGSEELVKWRWNVDYYWSRTPPAVNAYPRNDRGAAVSTTRCFPVHFLPSIRQLGRRPGSALSVGCHRNGCSG